MRKTLSTLSAAVLLGLSAPVFAALPQHVPNERSQAAQADLVFVGSVASIEYRQSGQADDKQRVPHTFVTYNVEEVLHGKADGKQVTLRFIGGRGEKARFLDVTGQPMFDAGDRDLLMVANNGTAGCPLVSCSNGRYRFINGKVFSEEGQSIELNAKGDLVRAGYYNLPEVMTHKVSQTLMTLTDHFEQGEERVEFTNSAGGAHLDDNQMIARVKSIARDLRNATPREFKNARADMPFVFSFEVVAAPAEKQARSMETKRIAAQSAQERAESIALRASGGNPVIGEYKARSNEESKGEQK